MYNCRHKIFVGCQELADVHKSILFNVRDHGTQCTSCMQELIIYSNSAKGSGTVSIVLG